MNKKREKEKGGKEKYVSLFPFFSSSPQPLCAWKNIDVISFFSLMTS
jgi:hypothetical protein